MKAKSIEAESSAEAAGGGGEGGESLPPSALEQELRDKTRALMSGRASCERKWRDSQLAFASILKAVNTNRTLHFLLSSLRQRDVVAKMHIELELWTQIGISWVNDPKKRPTLHVTYNFCKCTLWK